MADESMPVVREEKTAIAVAEQSEKMTLDAFAEAFVRSGYFKSTESVAQALVKIQAGRELGIPPFASMKGIHVVKEKLEFDGALLRTLIRRSDEYDYRIDALDNAKATMTLVSKRTGEMIGTATFTLEDAKQADLAGKDIWMKYPRNMLLNRCTSNLVRWYCPDVTVGPAYTLGELAEGVNVEHLQQSIRPVVRPAWIAPFMIKLRPYIEQTTLANLRKVYSSKETDDDDFLRLLHAVWKQAEPGKPDLPPQFPPELMATEVSYTEEEDNDG